jgi:protein KTI12
MASHNSGREETTHSSRREGTSITDVIVTANTLQAPRPAANTLQVLATTTTTIVTSLLAHVNSDPTATMFIIPSPPAKTPGSLVLHLPIRRVTLPEMQRMRRTFEGVQTKAQSSNGRAAGTWTQEGVASAFVAFLETAWDTAS